jgi:hypothetical protein
MPVRDRFTPSVETATYALRGGGSRADARGDLLRVRTPRRARWPDFQISGY